MTVEGAIFSALRGLVADRAYPDMAPAGVATPYLVYQQVGGRSFGFLERAVMSKKTGRFQVVVWSKTRAEAAALGLQIEAALITNTAFQATALGAPVADYDEETELRGNRQDFEIWSDR
jgi:hypothetical protein